MRELYVRDVFLVALKLSVVLNRWGEVADLNLVRDKDTGKPKGFGFLAYEDQRSTVIAVDNFNGIKVNSDGVV